MARIPTSEGRPRPSLDSLRGLPNVLAQAATGDAFGAGVFEAAAGFGQAVTNVANAERKRRRGSASITGRDNAFEVDGEEPFADSEATAKLAGTVTGKASAVAGVTVPAKTGPGKAPAAASTALERNLNAAANEIAAMLPHEYDAAIENVRRTMRPGGKGYAAGVERALEEINQKRLQTAIDKYTLDEPAVTELAARANAFATQARASAQAFEDREAERQFHVDMNSHVEMLRRRVEADPAKLPFVAAQIEGLYANAGAHLPPDLIKRDRIQAQRAVYRTAINTQVDRAPEKVVDNVRKGALKPLVRQGVLAKEDMARARQRAARAVKRQTQLAGATKRKAFAEFRANLEIAARRGEVGQKFIDRQHELGAITAAERNRYALIAKGVREAREEMAAQQRELEAIKAGGGTVGAAVLRGIRANLDASIAGGSRDPELVRLALGMGAITTEGARKRLERMRAGEAKVVEREALVERGRRADKEPLDPTNPKDRKAVDLHYKRDVKARFEAMAGKPEKTRQLVREAKAFVKKTGVVPKAMLDATERGLESDDPKVKASAAAVLTGVVRQAPDQVPYPAGDPKLTFAAAVDTNREAGFKPAAAVKKAETEVVKATPEDKRDRAEVYDRDRKAIEAQNRQFLKEHGLSERHLPAFNTEAERLYTQSGDINVARQRAFVAVLRGAEGQSASTGITPTGRGSEAAVRGEIEQNGQTQVGAVSGPGSEAAVRGEVNARKQEERNEALRRIIDPAKLRVVDPRTKAPILIRLAKNGDIVFRDWSGKEQRVPANLLRAIVTSSDGDPAKKRIAIVGIVLNRLVAQLNSIGSPSERQRIKQGLSRQYHAFIKAQFEGVPGGEKMARRIAVDAVTAVNRFGGDEFGLIKRLLPAAFREVFPVATTLSDGAAVAANFVPILGEIKAGERAVQAHQQWTEALERGDLAAARKHAKELHEELIGLIPFVGRIGRGAAKVLPRGGKTASEVLDDVKGRITSAGARLKERLQGEVKKLDDWLESTKPQPALAVPGGSGRGGRIPSGKLDSRSTQGTGPRHREVKKRSKGIVPPPPDETWQNIIKRNKALVIKNGHKARPEGRNLAKNWKKWLTAPKTGGARGHGNAHKRDLGLEKNAEYIEHTKNNLHWGIKIKVEHGNQRKWIYVSDLGDGRYVVTSTTWNGKKIFTHYPVTWEEYLNLRRGELNKKKRRRIEHLKK